MAGRAPRALPARSDDSGGAAPPRQPAPLRPIGGPLPQS
jgi:hypothetical protein